MRSTLQSKPWQVLLLLGVLSLALSSCAGTPTPDPWADYDPDTKPVAEPVALGAWPAPIEITETAVTFDLAGATALELYRVVGAGNTVIAGDLSTQVREQRTEIQQLLIAGKGQRRTTDMLKDQLATQQRHHAWEKAGLYGGMLLTIGACAATQ